MREVKGLGFWTRLFGAEVRSAEAPEMDPLLTALLRQDPITRADAMSVPAFAGCVKYISESVAQLPVKLYQRTEDGVEELRGDPRVALLNGDTGDTLSGYQLKQALAEDVVVEGGGYAYIRKERNEWLGLHYVELPAISFLPGHDPIFKRCDILVNGRTYRDFEFIKVTRATKDGVRGVGVLGQSQLPLAVSYNTLRYENTMVKTGGNKRGFLKAATKLTEEAMVALREAWRKLYGNSDESVVILNDKMDFKEASSTSVELQMNENKKTNAVEVCKLFTVPPSILDGSATDEEREGAFEVAVCPVLAAIAAALNRDFLLEVEKESLYWAFDTKQATMSGMGKRFAAYAEGIQSNVLQPDEARRMENLPPLGLSFIKLGLQDVLYDPEKETIFVPNTGVISPVGTRGQEQVGPEAAAPQRNDEAAGNAPVEEIAKVSLNGAQISGILQISQAVATGAMERGSALTLLTEAFPFDQGAAERILGNPKPMKREGGEEVES